MLLTYQISVFMYDFFFGALPIAKGLNTMLVLWRD